MRTRTLLAVATLFLMTACTPTPAATGSAADEEAIKAMDTQYADAWNKQDAKALSAMVTEDYHSVDMMGVHLEGRAAFEKATVDGFAASPPGQILTINHGYTKWLSGTSAVTGGTWTAAGAPAGFPSRGSWQSVLTKSGDTWLIAAALASVEPPVPAPMAADTSKVAK